MDKKKIIKILKIVLPSLAVLIVLAVIGALIYGHYLKNKGIPDYRKDIKLSGLISEVTVFRDKYGIPHIYALNDHDLYIAVGYCMAEDRLWQMDLLRRVTTGRLSEIFGEDLIETDLLFRSLRIQKKSEEIMEKEEPEILKCLNAFSQGVNQYIEQNKDDLPPEFSILGYAPEKWKPIHSINLIGYMAWDLTMPWGIETVMDRIHTKVGNKLYQELLPDIKGTVSHIYASTQGTRLRNDALIALNERTQPVVDLGLRVFNASNNWAVSGLKTETGKPLLANDMHLGLSIPGVWYQIHQCVEAGSDNDENATEGGNHLNVTGVTLPGSPAVIVGHNDHIAWGMTNVMIDDMDFFVEKLDPKNSKRYLYKGKWLDMDVQKEKIKIKGGDVVEREILFTVHGPVISGFKNIKGRALTMHWAGNYYSDEVQSIYKLNRARNFGDFKDALRTFKALSQNIVYADIWDNVGLFCAAGIPLRKKGDGIGIVPGWTDEYEWRGFVPFENQPFIYNPMDGFVLSANNKTAGNGYPHYISSWYYPPYRYDRIREMLTEKEKLSPADFMRMQNDKRSLLAKFMKDRTVKALSKAAGLDDTEKEALALFTSWDGTMGRDSSSAALFEKFYLTLIKNTFKDEMGDALFEKFIHERTITAYAMEDLFKKSESVWFDDISTADKKESLDDCILKSFKEAVSWCDDEMGGTVKKWKWGDIHHLALKHPLGKVWILNTLLNLNRTGYSVGGSFHTVCACNYKFYDPFEMRGGPSQRHVYDLSDWDKSYTVLPTGESGNPGSPYYCDQTDLYVAGKYHHDYFSKEMVIRNAKYTMKFTQK